jgi:hypothetical protein
MVTWQSFDGDELLVRDDGATLAHLKPSPSWPGLWRIVRPKVVGGEHDRIAARILAARMCRLTARDFVGDAA